MIRVIPIVLPAVYLIIFNNAFNNTPFMKLGSIGIGWGEAIYLGIPGINPKLHYKCIYWVRARADLKSQQEESS